MKLKPVFGSFFLKIKKTKKNKQTKKKPHTCIIQYNKSFQIFCPQLQCQTYMSIQFTALSFSVHWFEVNGWGWSQFIITILWATGTVAIDILLFPNPLRGTLPRINWCGSNGVFKVYLFPFSSSPNRLVVQWTIMWTISHYTISSPTERVGVMVIGAYYSWGFKNVWFWFSTSNQIVSMVGHSGISAS